MKDALSMMMVTKLKINHFIYKKVTTDDEIISKDKLKEISTDPRDSSSKKMLGEVVNMMAESILMEEVEKSISLDALLADPGCDLHRLAGVAGVEVHVVGDQEWPGPDRGGPGTSHLVVEDPWSEVRPLLGVSQSSGESFVLPGANRREVLALEGRSRGFVEVDRDPQLGPDPGADATRDLRALLHGDARDRDEGADVGGPHARVGAAMARHVDHLCGPGNRAEGGLFDCRW